VVADGEKTIYPGFLRFASQANDAERLSVDPAMRHVVGGRATERPPASTSQMGRFGAEVLTQPGNLAALTKLSGNWIDRLRECQPMRELILDMDNRAHLRRVLQRYLAYYHGWRTHLSLDKDAPEVRQVPRRHTNRPAWP
jgi:hypothetical protein